MTLVSPRSLLFLFATGLIGCDGLGPADAGPPPEAVEFLDNHAWQLVYTMDAPFGTDGSYACDPSGRLFEGDESGAPVFEVNTDVCDNVTFTQPITADLRAGELIHFTLWHLQLASMDPEAEGVTAIALGDTPVWEQRFEIPSAEAFYHPFVEIPEDVPEGTPVYLHVRNHGANSYKFVSFDTGPAAAYPTFEGDAG